ncbi:MAG TPA: hypothetical protein VIX18_05010 [Nitrospirota bacterium]
MTARHALYGIILTLVLHTTLHAAVESDCESHSQHEPQLCSYEPNTIGYTKDSDDTGFMDFKLSVRYQLFPVWSTRGLNFLNSGLGEDSAFYFAFTGRFGQYIGTRESSPVVGKRFNPKLFYRYWTDEQHRRYVDFSFLAHESNGQSISDPTEYDVAKASAEKPEYANDQLSRGWDYVELVWKGMPVLTDTTSLSTYVTLKYFMHRGPLQGKAENYNDWENNPEGKPRDRVNGVAAMIKYQKSWEWMALNDMKIAALYETGYRRMFRYNTWRLELGAKLFQLPLTLWGQTGYGSDLAQYYKKVNSYGLAVEIGSF